MSFLLQNSVLRIASTSKSETDAAETFREEFAWMDSEEEDGRRLSIGDGLDIWICERELLAHGLFFPYTSYNYI